MAVLSDREFSQFQRFIFDAAGITMSTAKKALVSGRLSKRLHHHQLDSYGDYFNMVASGAAPEEASIAVDLLTTNETYFFREGKHFDMLRRVAGDAARSAQPFRVWSAASSSGEEAYSIAMVLADVLEERGWEVLGTDISTRVLARARQGHYPMERADLIPPHYLKRFCLKGQDKYAGTLLVERALRQRVTFEHANLNAPMPQVGMFDFVFLRNVMIYFNTETKRQVVARVLAQLKPGGILVIGHSETLNDISSAVVPVAPSIYRKP
ncbi:MAG: protein-glutamate O-methyltransferase CheR [Pseudomonadota bacterium]